MDDSAAPLRPYRGRFAPTPSGPLHAGSLMAALASWLCARSVGGTWRLRMDDLDAQRCSSAHAATILRQLEAHGLTWDGPVYYESDHRPVYEEALDALTQIGRTYACDCTRARLRRTSRAGPDGPVYDRRCLTRQHTVSVPAALRLDAGDGTMTIVDRRQGLLSRRIAQDIGDFVVRRADGIPGYHLACVVDEAQLGITEVVRGADLLGAAFCQRLLAQVLGLPAPVTCLHVPLVLDIRGAKLSKQNHAVPLDAHRPGTNLCTALQRLGQRLPVGLHGESPDVVLAWAVRHWCVEAVPIAPQSIAAATHAL
ncbi:MAG TPA: tRNA glutamyl-Q(34) synthetase GluQRS [Nevskiaceae bacterium]